MAKTLFIEDNLIVLLMKALRWHWVNNPNGCDYIANRYEEEISADDYEFYAIPTTVVEWEKSGETMNCDGVLFFGDGCVEFHDADECDAFHWDNFTDESVRKITEAVAKRSKKIGKVSFDLTFNKATENVVLDFEGEVDYAYLTSEDGPWHMIDFNGETYDCQCYGDENGELAMQFNLMEFNGMYYKHTPIYEIGIIDNLIIEFVD